MSLADEWHDPRGPESLPLHEVDADDALDFIQAGFDAAQAELRPERMIEERESLAYFGPGVL